MHTPRRATIMVSGYVVSDCNAVDDVWMWHEYVATRAEAAAISLNAGTDLDCGYVVVCVLCACLCARRVRWICSCAFAY